MPPKSIEADWKPAVAQRARRSRIENGGRVGLWVVVALLAAVSTLVLGSAIALGIAHSVLRRGRTGLLRAFRA